MADKTFMIYGAYGYTGELIARQAVAQGMTPVLAGRDDDRVHELARSLGLTSRTFGLSEAAEITPHLSDIDVLLHCAGPFSATAPQMIAACIHTGTHYLDIAGEIDVFEHAFSRDGDARSAGVALCCGAGFDVVPTDCVAAYLHAALPDACRLALGFDSRTGLSPGTARTTVEALAEGGRVRRDDELTEIAWAEGVRTIDFGAGPKQAACVPWGDIATAWRTTGIGDIAVYIPVSPARIRQLRRLDRIGPLVALGPVQRWLKWRAGRIVGPDATRREHTETHVWGEVVNAAGERRVARLTVANGYTVTVHASLAMVGHLFEHAPSPGTYTPSQLAGRTLAERLPGSGQVVIDDH
ncbi:saccharopine dehydrogenase NADP-binding domain-containing protein [Salinisphaera sp. T31B1]|uniref:saccharopine dehydrogenase family protein n=1 Tax=Salinisphaera sp. T31B1 TaxID=727963 RepID=UPI0033413739